MVDPAVDGTRLVEPDQTASPIGAAGGALLFTRITGSPLTSALWRTDGTAGGTLKLKDGFSADAGHQVGDSHLFGGPGGLWESDGTAAGTLLLKAGPRPTQWHRVGDAAYFMTGSPGYSSDLWKTDGTEAGTVLIGPAVIGNAGDANQPSMAHVGDTLYYVGAQSGGPTQVYATEGPGSVRQITQFVGQYSGALPTLVAAGNKVLFVGPGGTGRDVWQTDGTPLNYSRVPGFAPLAQAGGEAQNLFAVGGSVFFTEKPYNSSPRLWRVGVEPVVLDEDGVLSVNGTDPAEADPAHPAGADQIGLAAAGDTLTVTVNGAAHAFAAAGVRHVTVNGLGGDDTLTVEGIPAARLTFNGGGGQDTLTVRGTGGDDTVVFSDTPHVGPEGTVHAPGVETVSIDLLGGDDAVTVLGPDGAPAIHGGEGNDTVVVDDHDRALELEYAVSDAGVGRSFNGGPVAPVLTFDGFEDVMLRAGAWANLIAATPSATAHLAVDGSAPPAEGVLGRDRLRVDAAGAAGTRHTAGAVAGSGEWTFADRRPISYANVEQTDDGVPLSASINLTPNPRRQPVAEVAIVFSEQVSGLDLSDLRLTRGNDPQNLLTGAQTLTTGDGGTTWVLGGLAGPTAADGRYLLALPALGTGVVDAVGIPLSDDLSYAITVDTVGPTADVVDVAPDPANAPVPWVYISFSEPVKDLEASDLTLSFNGGPNLLTNEQNLGQINATTYRLTDLSGLTRAAGEYVLALRPAAESGVTDLAGNSLAAGASDTFRVRGQVLARQLFDNNTVADGFTPGPDARDDQAIPADRRALLPGQTANGLNFTGSSRGINGLFIDLTPSPAALTAADFVFTVGNDNDPGGWAAAPAPASITVAPGRGVFVSSRHERSDRVTVIWPDGAIRNIWLRVEVLPTVRTGLITSDVFYFGNLVGSILRPAVDGRAVVGADDVRLARASLDSPTADMRADHNRDRRVNALDLAVVRRNLGASLRMIAPPAAAAPTVAGGVARVGGAVLPRDARPVRRGVLNGRSATHAVLDDAE